MKSIMLADACKAVTILANTDNDKWAEMYVNLRIDFFNKHCHGLVSSTAHGVNFFENIVMCFQDAELWTEKGVYGDNFRKLMTLNQNER